MKKSLKRIVAVLVAVTLLAGFAAMTASAKPVSEYQTGDTLYYGFYPQSRVTDKNVIRELNGFQSIMGVDDIYCNGIMYRRVFLTSYTPYKLSNPTMNTDTLNSGQIRNGFTLKTPYWFVYEPIKWTVLGIQDGGLLVMSDLVIDAKPYNANNNAYKWDSSTLRTWLNHNFLNVAFSDVQQSAILTSDVVNGSYPGSGLDGGANTQDKIYLLSYNEAVNSDFGFFKSQQSWYDGHYEYCPLRDATCTDFARSQGVWLWDLYEYDPYDYDRFNGNVFYWLRDRGMYDGMAATVLSNGRISTGHDVDYACFGVRPVMRLDASVDITESTPMQGGATLDENSLSINLYESTTITTGVPTTWYTSDETVVSVTQDGVITGELVGTAIVLAVNSETNEIIRTITVTVKNTWWQWVLNFLLGWLF